jgi:hypothetical protein
MNGLEMMMKSFGLDPASITKTAADMAATINRIEAQQIRIEEKLDAIIRALPQDMEDAPTPERIAE